MDDIPPALWCLAAPFGAFCLWLLLSMPGYVRRDQAKYKQIEERSRAWNEWMQNEPHPGEYEYQRDWKQGGDQRWVADWNRYQRTPKPPQVDFDSTVANWKEPQGTLRGCAAFALVGAVMVVFFVTVFIVWVMTGG